MLIFLLIFFALLYLFTLSLLIVYSGRVRVADKVVVLVVYSILFFKFDDMLVFTCCTGFVEFRIGILIISSIVIFFLYIIYLLFFDIYPLVFNSRYIRKECTQSLVVGSANFYLTLVAVSYFFVFVGIPDLTVFHCIMNIIYSVWLLDSYLWVLVRFYAEQKQNQALLSMCELPECTAVFLPLAFIFVFNFFPIHLILYNICFIV